MPDAKTRTLKPSILASDRQSFAALKNIADYAPANADYAVNSIQDALTDLDRKLEAAAQADATAKAARDEAVASAWAFHNKITGAKDSVSAQFGKDSNQVQSVGRKKTTEYKKPTRKPNDTSGKK